MKVSSLRKSMIFVSAVAGVSLDIENYCTLRLFFCTA